MEKRKVAFNTLGCKVNQYETSALESLFRAKGYEIVDFSSRADVYVINTCTVTHIGDRKSRQLIRRAVRAHPGAQVVVTGCYAQTSPGEILEIPGVNLVVGTSDRSQIVELVEKAAGGDKPLNVVTDIMKAGVFEALPAALDQNRVRGFLKIQEGCNNFCTYCIVPYSRGPLRSRNLQGVLDEAQKLLDQGYKEIVLAGIHTGAYGKDLAGEVNLARLVNEISRLKGLYRLRLSSLEPQDIDFDLIDALAASPVVCRHFHLPLQSGDDQVLRRMKRRYDTGRYQALVSRIRDKMPGTAITTDVMVGFPGETEENFMNTVDFIREINFTGLHVFKYSPRRGTAAAAFKDQIAPAEKERRSKKLIRLSDELQREFLSWHINKEMSILVEQCGNQEQNACEGHSKDYVKCVFPVSPGWEQGLRGTLVLVRGEKIEANYIRGRII